MISRLLYSLAWYLITPALIGYLLWRSRRQPEYRKHWRERWAWVPRRRRRGRPLIWIHAVSVGETRAAEPLIRALQGRYPHAEWLLTCTTPTGREAARTLFGESVRLSYLPYDYPLAMRRFLKAWGPSIGIVMETELWPNLTAQAQRLRVPLAAVNVRLSERSLQKGERYGSLIRDALSRMDTVAAQTKEDAKRLARLGRNDIRITGNLKFDVLPSAPMVQLGGRWKQALGKRQVVLAASTRDGEEALLLDAWSRYWAQPRAESQGARPVPLLLLVPRHPQRFDEVQALCTQSGHRVLRRSAFTTEVAPGDAGGGQAAVLSDALAQADIVLGDSMGEMFAYYAMADVAIIGGSILRFGAQNLIEASALGVPVVLGPHSFNFKEAAQQAIACGAALRVDDADQAIASSLSLLCEADRWQQMHTAALEFAAAHRGATTRTIEALEPLLIRCRGRLEQQQVPPEAMPAAGAR